MVPQILASGATAITNNLISILGPDVLKACCIKGDLEKLREILNMIEAVVTDAEMQQVEKEAVRLWLRRLKDIAHDAEDVLDELAYEDLRYKMEIQNRVLEEVRNFFSCSNPIVFRFNMVWKLKAITEKLEGLQRDASTLQLQISPTTDSTINDQRRETAAFVVDLDIIGRETDKSNIVDMLIGHGNQEILSVFAIVGLGGLGKTTLAQLVYKDEAVAGFFNERVWICVSEDFNVKRLLAQMAKLSDSDGLSMNQVVEKVHEKLRGKRLLLILDDVWNTNYTEWDKLATFLKVGEVGSKIIATTRSNEVALAMRAISTHHLKGLSEEESWSLFTRIAFSHGAAEETPTLELIGREIVSKCKGVPLAVKAMGALMHSKREERQWSDIKCSEIWNLPDESEIIPALKLSYDHFPPAVKQCFSYCSIFPKDHDINKRTLIQMWMAQGYLGTSKGNRAMEDVGDEYFNYLQWNSFIQDVRTREHFVTCEEEVWCKMHDLVHDLAQSISGSECSNGEVLPTLDASKVLHYSSYVRGRELPKELYAEKGLRSLIQPYYRDAISSVSKFKLLRVLELGGNDIKEIPSSIGNLKHLRYLDLSSNRMETLPDSITRLYNLQTLRLDHCYFLHKLPLEMRRLINLRYLYMRGEERNRHGVEFPKGIGQLSCLQTLSLFVVGKEKGRRIQELRHLCLGGYLHIRHLENVTNGIAEAKEAKLMEKPNLQALRLSWARESNGFEEDVLQGLEPHPNLKTLHVNFYPGVRFPGWTRSMGHLVEVQLHNCDNCVHLPALGQLPCLRQLGLHGLGALKCLGKEFYNEDIFGEDTVAVAFPSLKVMELIGMKELVDWVEVINAFPRLTRLDIRHCPKLMNMPTCFPLLEYLFYENSNCMALNVLLGNKGSGGQYPEIGGCSNMEAIIHNERIRGGGALLTSLKTLYIWNCLNLTALPSIQHLHSLRELSITGCKELKFTSLEGLRSLTALQKLTIDGCPNLTSLPSIQHLQSLQELHIDSCEELKSTSLEGLRNLTALQKLTIGGNGVTTQEFDDVIVGVDDFMYLSSLQSLEIADFFNLKSLPEQIQHLSTLKRLRIFQLKNLEALPNWLAKLTSLESLSILYCSRLTHLPTQEAMQSLVALTHLSIFDCPILSKRCDPERGEEWHKIAHMPSLNLYISKGHMNVSTGVVTRAKARTVPRHSRYP